MKKIEKNNKKTHKVKIIILLTCILMLFLTGYSIGKQATKTTVLTEGEKSPWRFLSNCCTSSSRFCAEEKSRELVNSEPKNAAIRQAATNMA